MQAADTESKNTALENAQLLLEKNAGEILAANGTDIKNAREKGLSDALSNA
jgi:gamma-glutamyl phosphate reductase